MLLSDSYAQAHTAGKLNVQHNSQALNRELANSVDSPKFEAAVRRTPRTGMRIRLLGQFVHGSILVLAGIEGALFVVAFLLAFWLRLGSWDPEPASFISRPLLCATVFSASILLSFFAFGLYSSRQRARTFGLFVRLATATMVGTLSTVILFYAVPPLWVGRGVLGLTSLFAFTGAVMSRVMFWRIVDEGIFKRRVLIYGTGRRAAAICELRRKADRRGFDIVGFVQPKGESQIVPREQIINSSADFIDLCERHRVDEIVVAMEDRRRGFPIHELVECRLLGMEVTELASFLERETGRVPIDVIDPSWIIFGAGFCRDPLRLLSARTFDVIASLLMLVLALPVVICVVLAIKLEDGWRAPILYRQTRVGFGGRTFDLLKLRSMCENAELEGGAQWTQRSDPRITRVGALVRPLRIDELPQILNVLRGDMSFVGPRPERPEFVASLADKIPYYMRRHCVKPGITGWAQLCYPYGSSVQDATQKLQYDLYYIKNNNLFFDLAILFQTAEVVLLGKGAR